MYSREYWGSFSLILLSCLSGHNCQDSAEQPTVELLYPADGETVGSPNELVWASVNGAPPGSDPLVEFFFSNDGVNYAPLEGRPAPGFGDDSTAYSVDLSTFPSGPLFLKASSLDQEVVHKLTVDRLPEVSCTVTGAGTSAEFDCSASTDEDGPITEYQWNFGDGTVVSTSQSMMPHQYAESGEYSLEVVACDEHGLCGQSQWIAVLPSQPLDTPALQEGRSCGCEKMILRYDKNKSSTLGDFRRRDETAPRDRIRYLKAPLGPDSAYLTFNFEVEVQLKPKSRYELCNEGQRAERTSQLGSGAETHAKKCASECPPVVSCKNNDSCDSKKCVGGLDDNRCLYFAEEETACAVGGGTVTPIVGSCMEHPFDEAEDAPENLGWDDYEVEVGKSDIRRTGAKRYAGDGKVYWLDSPGRGKKEEERYEYRAEFFAFLEGNDGSKCDCKFRIVLVWDGTEFTEETKLEKLGGNCEIDD